VKIQANICGKLCHAIKRIKRRRRKSLEIIDKLLFFKVKLPVNGS
jgi:hypothetical protein